MDSPFEQLKHVDENGEYWLAREMQVKLGYVEWRKFEDAIERAKISCKIASHEPSDHFVPSDKMIKLGKGAKRRQKDYRLTRYACYLIAMNGDPRKEAIAQAQAYFTAQTYYAETVQAQQALPPPKTVSLSPLADRLAATVEQVESRIPSTHFAMATETHREVRHAEFLGWLDHSVDAFPEISVGRMWAKHAREDLGIDTSKLPSYCHTGPGLKKEVFPLCYPMEYLKEFRRWFREDYLPNHCPIYVGNRKKRLERQARIAGTGQRLIG